MDNPCYKCELRKPGCHSSCPKSPSYDDWKRWYDERSRADKKARQDNTAYKTSLKSMKQYRR